MSQILIIMFDLCKDVDINKLCRSGMTILGRAAQLGLFLFVKQVSLLYKHI